MDGLARVSTNNQRIVAGLPQHLFTRIKVCWRNFTLRRNSWNVRADANPGRTEQP